ncbi:MAG: hypothetical protein ACC657_15250, partial [Thiohalomonadales bacterium]
MDRLLKNYFIIFIMLISLVACGGGRQGSIPIIKAEVKTYDLIVIMSGNGNGTVSLDPKAIVCTTTCAGRYNENTLVTLVPVASDGSVFTGWTETSNAACTIGVVTMNSGVICNAIFDLLANTTVYDLSITMAGTGVGIVTSDPTGINCGAVCTRAFAADSVITLIPTPAAGSTFVSWTGTGCETEIVTMTAAVNCTATFNLSPEVDLTVTLDGTGSGSVTSSPAGIDCGANCVAPFTVDSLVTLTATPAEDNSFVAWSGDPDCSDGIVTMATAMTCTATFDVVPGAILYDLTVTLAGTGSGRVSSNPSGIDCGTGTGCLQSFAANTSVILTAIPGS